MRTLLGVALLLCAPATAQEVPAGDWFSVIFRGHVYGRETLQVERVANERGDPLPSPVFYVVDEHADFVTEEVPAAPLGEWFLAIRREDCAPIIARIEFDVRDRDYYVVLPIQHGECTPEEEGAQAHPTQVYEFPAHRSRDDSEERRVPTLADAIRLEGQLIFGVQQSAPPVDTHVRIHAVLNGERGALVVHTDDDESNYHLDPANEILSRRVADYMMRLRIQPFDAEHASVDFDFVLPGRSAD